MAKQTTNVGPIDPGTGKPFYTPQQWAALQAQDAATARAHDEQVARSRATAAQENRPGAINAPAEGLQGTGGGRLFRGVTPPPSRVLPIPQHVVTQERLVAATGGGRLFQGMSTENVRILAPNAVGTRAHPASIIPRDSPTAGPPKIATINPQRGSVPTTGGSSSRQLPAPTTTPGTADAVLSQTQQNNAEAEVATVLGYNVDPNLAKNALSWVEGMQASGADDTTIQNEMYNQNWFKTAFPGITQALANGISPPDPITYSKDLSATQSMLAGFGIPTGAISPQLYGELVGRGLSSADIKNNIGAVFSAAPAVSAAAQADLSQWYGVPNTPGAIAALLIDPKGALARENGGNGLLPPSAPLAQTVGAAAVGGALAAQSGFSKLSKQDLLGMASTATSQQIGNAASADTGSLAATETGTKNAPTVTEAQLLESGGNVGIQTNQAAKQAVSAAVGARTAQFAGGGAAAGAGQPGQSGAGYGTQ